MSLAAFQSPRPADNATQTASGETPFSVFSGASYSRVPDGTVWPAVGGQMPVSGRPNQARIPLTYPVTIRPLRLDRHSTFARGDLGFLSRTDDQSDMSQNLYTMYNLQLLNEGLEMRYRAHVDQALRDAAQPPSLTQADQIARKRQRVAAPHADSLWSHLPLELDEFVREMRFGGVVSSTATISDLRRGAMSLAMAVRNYVELPDVFLPQAGAAYDSPRAGDHLGLIVRRVNPAHLYDRTYRYDSSSEGLLKQLGADGAGPLQVIPVFGTFGRLPTATAPGPQCLSPAAYVHHPTNLTYPVHRTVVRPALDWNEQPIAGGAPSVLDLVELERAHYIYLGRVEHVLDGARATFHQRTHAMRTRAGYTRLYDSGNARLMVQLVAQNETPLPRTTG